ncbi:D-alanyl-D-alanine carboxypeptidase family protein [Jeotgalibacillus aurantiacus]|uniref:D-alanyl-D-alanine carboxypeptidase family protein n=1 Tax=Jeotgalibacillus aurantiacus TaxID=2763266 RepID=UPI001D0B7D4A|nr:D-alanyl-D-alanine carboxypeptidase family protein [Jeotgalibacillus aurantiacus]
MKKILTMFIAAGFFFSASSVSAEENSLMNGVKSGILIDENTGMILLEKNANEKLPPASMTKIGTLLMIMEAIDSGKLKWTDEVQASEEAASMGGSQVYLKEGETMTVEEMVKAISVASANDASVAMAEHLAGSEAALVDQINKKAKSLGLTNTTFKNVTGLPAEGHESTANDMAILAKELLRHKKITEFTGIYEDFLRQDAEEPFWLVNTNKLVRSYKGADGLKTGFTKEAMYCLTATAQKNNMRLISVVFGAETSAERNRITAGILDYGFTHYQTKTLYKAGHAIAEVKISKGAPHEVKAVIDQPLSWLNDGKKEANVQKIISVDRDLKAPMKKGTQVGSVILKVDGKEVKELPLLTKHEVKRASWGDLFNRSLLELTDGTK